MTRRTKKEMEALDLKIHPLYERGIGCRVIGQVLEENPVTVLKRVRKMGIARSREEAVPKVENKGLPFGRDPTADNLRIEAVGVAIQWFLSRGYIPSVPVEPTRYDLVVESDAGLKRVQVKSATTKNNDREMVGIARSEYQGVESKYARRRKRVPYEPDDIDLFFIVTATGKMYLIPIGVVEGQLTLNLDDKYQAFKV